MNVDVPLISRHIGTGNVGFETGIANIYPRHAFKFRPSPSSAKGVGVVVQLCGFLVFNLGLNGLDDAKCA